MKSAANFVSGALSAISRVFSNEPVPLNKIKYMTGGHWSYTVVGDMGAFAGEHFSLSARKEENGWQAVESYAGRNTSERILAEGLSGADAAAKIAELLPNMHDRITRLGLEQGISYTFFKAGVWDTNPTFTQVLDRLKAGESFDAAPGASGPKASAAGFSV